MTSGHDGSRLLYMELTALLAEIEDLAEALSGAYECYGDMYAEYRGEIAHYGDAWAGSADQISRMRQGLDRGERELKALTIKLDADYPAYGPPAIRTLVDLYDPYFPEGEPF